MPTSTTPRPRGRPSKYSKKRHKQALEGFRARGSNHAAAEAADVDPATIAKWRRERPDFQADALAAIDECGERITSLAQTVVERRLRKELDGEQMVKTRTKEGEEPVEFSEPYEVSDPALKAALTRFDKRWSHPDGTGAGGIHIDASGTGGPPSKIVVELVRPGATTDDATADGGSGERP